MKTGTICLLQGLFLLGLVVFANTGYAGEVATFKAFYSESAGWGTMIWAGVAAVAIGAVVYFTGGLASPLVAGPAAAIGGWLGGTMGLSGAVAVKAGLAMLGGGAIAAGGLGMAGGAALVTVALEFGTSAVVGYAIDAHDTSYNNQEFIERSKNMAALPLPVNVSGSKPYEKKLEMLKAIDSTKPLSDPANLKIMNDAVLVYSSVDDDWTGKEWKKLQLNTLHALLWFSMAQYDHAKIQADAGILRAKNEGYKSTLPSFIYAVSSIYSESVNITKATNYFRTAILEEPDNQLIPLLFSIYLDRIIYRFTSDEKADEANLKEIALIAADPKIKQHAPVTLSVIMVRYFTLIKLKQTEITALSTTSNSTIKNSPHTAKRLEAALKSYDILLTDANLCLQYLLEQKIDEKQQQEVAKFPSLLAKYSDDRQRLTSLITQANSSAK